MVVVIGLLERRGVGVVGKDRTSAAAASE